MQTSDYTPAWVSNHGSELDQKMGLELLTVAPAQTTGRCPVAGNTRPGGIWHGGASLVMAESLASFAAMTHAQTLGKQAYGVDVNATHHRAVRTGFVCGTATAIRLGRTIASYEVILLDDAGERVCTARVTCQLRDTQLKV